MTREPQWFAEIGQRSRHRLLHDTSFDRALSILCKRQIHGVPGWYSSHEGFPHFIYEGWNQENNLPTVREIRLEFEVERPARFRGEGTDLPRPGYVEVYQNLLGDPWQCSLHPEGNPLRFIGSDPSGSEIKKDLPSLWTLNAWSGRLPMLRRLSRHLVDAETEEREIQPALI